MIKERIILFTLIFISTGTALSFGPESDTDPPETQDGVKTISHVMKHAMTKGLCRKVVKGSATEAEKAQLVKLFEKLTKLTPKKGANKSWKGKTAALVKAAKDVAAGKNAQDALKKAVNCTACHKIHR